MENTTRQKNKEKEDLKSTINQLDTADAHHQKQNTHSFHLYKEYSPGQTLCQGHTTSLNKF